MSRIGRRAQMVVAQSKGEKMQSQSRINRILLQRIRYSPLIRNQNRRGEEKEEQQSEAQSLATKLLILLILLFAISPNFLMPSDNFRLISSTAFYLAALNPSIVSSSRSLANLRLSKNCPALYFQNKLSSLYNNSCAEINPLRFSKDSIFFLMTSH
ncbi:hypothetical protein FGO68_gene7500 [Halteria grandinella]|uniref:Uncharacterized protein n=1 Tax=Halteria grandinella TaxID=5974 RepID=A0A8J8P339_HALGN|nr:hypothetical protein FGO68_gene7500 [Halteria grandinella]